jgi:hypothetical protein
MIELRIDPDLQGRIPPPIAQERAALEAELRRDGCRDALAVWFGERPVCPACGTPADPWPPEQRLEYRARWRRHDMNALAELLDEPGFAEPDPVTVGGNRATEGCEKYFLDLSVLACSIQDGWSALMATWSMSRKQLALTQLRQWHARLGEWIQAIEEDLSHGTYVDDISAQ